MNPIAGPQYRATEFRTGVGRGAELLAEAIDEGWSGRCPVEAALAEYERRRNAATLEEFHENLALAQFQPIPAEVTQLRRALRSRPEETNRFFMAREGMIPHETFFNPDNLQRLLS